jgi:hypothetical protein
MNHAQVHIVERELGQASAACSEPVILEMERRVCRARQLVERQRQLVDRIGNRIPAATALLLSFERSAALLERSLAIYRSDDFIAASARDAVHSSDAILSAMPAGANELSFAKTS